MPICKRCGREVEEVSKKSGYCPECSVKAVAEAIKSLREKKGKAYEKWLIKVAKAIEEERLGKMRNSVYHKRRREK
ncbi:MAG: hypothetical protein JRE40_15300 [Deltaproteobacteria bacterium]|nr:hypothetical protein [Deltaproteobacteria bacterium]